MPPYQLKEKINEGTSGEVFLGIDLGNNEKVIIKKYRRINTNVYRELCFLKILKKICQQDNILCFKDLQRVDGDLWLITEYLEGSDLFNLLKKDKPPEKERIEIMLKIAQVIKNLHVLRIIHKDIKLENLFIKNDGTIKVFDFDTSCIEGEKACKTPLGTLGYIDPELNKGNPATLKSDIYSLGLLFLELETWKSFNPDNYTNVRSGVLGKLKYLKKSKLKDLITIMLKENPEDRPNICQVIFHIQKILYIK